MTWLLRWGLVTLGVGGLAHLAGRFFTGLLE